MAERECFLGCERGGGCGTGGVFCVSVGCGLWIAVGQIVSPQYGADVGLGYVYGALLEAFDSPVEEKLGLEKTGNFISALESSVQVGNDCWRGSGEKEIMDGNSDEDWAFRCVTEEKARIAVGLLVLRRFQELSDCVEVNVGDMRCAIKVADELANFAWVLICTIKAR